MGIGKATRRPAAPRPTTDKGPGPSTAAGHLSDATAVVRQRDLPAGDELKAALAVLQLPHLPQGVAELRNLVGERHPNPWKTWKWQHVASYQALFTVAVEAGRARAAANREARKPADA